MYSEGNFPIRLIGPNTYVLGGIVSGSDNVVVQSQEDQVVIRVAPVSVTTTTDLHVDTFYYPDGTIQGYRLSMSGTPGINLEAGTPNVTITTGIDVTYVNVVPVALNSSSLLITPMYYPSSTTIQSYQVEWRSSHVQVGSGLMASYGLDTVLLSVNPNLIAASAPLRSVYSVTSPNFTLGMDFDGTTLQLNTSSELSVHANDVIQAAVGSPLTLSVVPTGSPTIVNLNVATPLEVIANTLELSITQPLTLVGGSLTLPYDHTTLQLNTSSELAVHANDVIQAAVGSPLTFTTVATGSPTLANLNTTGPLAVVGGILGLSTAVPLGVVGGSLELSYDHTTLQLNTSSELAVHANDVIQPALESPLTFTTVATGSPTLAGISIASPLQVVGSVLGVNATSATPLPSQVVWVSNTWTSALLPSHYLTTIDAAIVYAMSQALSPSELVIEPATSAYSVSTSFTAPGDTTLRSTAPATLQYTGAFNITSPSLIQMEGLTIQTMPTISSATLNLRQCSLIATAATTVTTSLSASQSSIIGSAVVLNLSGFVLLNSTLTVQQVGITVGLGVTASLTGSGSNVATTGTFMVTGNTTTLNPQSLSWSHSTLSIGAASVWSGLSSIVLSRVAVASTAALTLTATQVTVQDSSFACPLGFNTSTVLINDSQLSAGMTIALTTSGATSNVRVQDSTITGATLNYFAGGTVTNLTAVFEGCTMGGALNLAGWVNLIGCRILPTATLRWSWASGSTYSCIGCIWSTTFVPTSLIATDLTNATYCSMQGYAKLLALIHNVSQTITPILPAPPIATPVAPAFDYQPSITFTNVPGTNATLLSLYQNTQVLINANGTLTLTYTGAGTLNTVVNVSYATPYPASLITS